MIAPGAATALANGVPPPNNDEKKSLKSCS